MAFVSGTASVQVYSAAGAFVANLSSASDLTSCWIETKDLDLGIPQRAKHLDALVVQMTNLAQQTDARVIVKWRDNLADPLNEEAPESIGISGGPVFLRPPGARYFRLRIEDPAVRERWKMVSLEVFGQLGALDF
jgi:hypothetical protein